MAAFRWCVLIAFALYARLCVANIDKKVFLGPPAVRIPAQHPTIQDLALDRLQPGGPHLRTHLACEFTKNGSHKGWPSWKFDEDTGKAHWLLLDNLVPDQRYEIRLCWSSSQPSSFRLRFHELSTVWDTPKLITSLSEYSHERHRTGLVPISSGERGDRETSILLLQIFAAADFFTTNETMMKNPPAIAIDISLDPYIYNLVPTILIPVILYITVVVVFSFLTGRGILSWLRTMAAGPEIAEEKKAQ